MDVLSLGPNITESDLSLDVLGNDLIVRVLDNGLLTTDQITLSDWFNVDNRIESIQFNDGTVWDVGAIQSRLPDTITLVDGIDAQGSGNVTTYTFTPGSDNPPGFAITLTDAGGLDAIQFNRAVLTVAGNDYYATPSLTGYSRDGNDLVLDIAVNSNIGSIPDGSGAVRIQDYYTAAGFIETIAFFDGVLNENNLAPVVNDTAVDQVIELDTSYNYPLTTDTFTDSQFDLLTVSASVVSGPLPGWLNFDAETLTFSGTPTTGDSEFLEIIVTARDAGGLTASVDFNLNVGNVNLAPTVADAIEDQTAKAQEVFNFVIPSNTFSDMNLNDTLTYSVLSLVIGQLPAWLSFDANTGTFSGTPGDADVGSIDLIVTATDGGGLSATDTFSLTVNEFNVAPEAWPDYATVTYSPPPAVNSDEFLVNTTTSRDLFNPAVIGLASSGFVAVWAHEERISGQRLLQ